MFIILPIDIAKDITRISIPLNIKELNWSFDKMSEYYRKSMYKYNWWLKTKMYKFCVPLEKNLENKSPDS